MHNAIKFIGYIISIILIMLGIIMILAFLTFSIDYMYSIPTYIFIIGFSSILLVIGFFIIYFIRRVERKK